VGGCQNLSLLFIPILSAAAVVAGGKFYLLNCIIAIVRVLYHASYCYNNNINSEKYCQPVLL
jgi:hypothetical protein